MSNSDILILFLRNLANLVEQNKITRQQVQLLSDLCINYKFLNQSDKYSENELMSFFSIGWYVSTMLKSV
jgi:hypothetical protein